MVKVGISLCGLLIIELSLLGVIAIVMKSQPYGIALVVFIMILIAKLTISLGLEALSGGFFQNVDCSMVHSTWVRIPKNDGFFLHGVVYREINAITDTRPYIIVAHGMNCAVEHTQWFAIPLVRAGFHVLAFNQNGHGLAPHKSPGNHAIYPELMVNVHDVVNFVLKQAECLRDASGKPIIGFIGHSTGGLMALSQAYLNPHIRVTIALSQIHDFMEAATRKVSWRSPQFLFKIGLKLGGAKINYTDAENRIISPKFCLRPDPQNSSRVFMIHAVDDPLPITDAHKNRDLAHLPAKNCLFLAKGGHDFRTQETLVVGQVITWFLTYLK